MTATVTRFLAKSTQIEPAHDPHKWIVDSAANASITSFKNTLHNYVEFEQAKSVKGFGGKQENAYGQGSIILTDSRGNEEVLEDVVYIPESPEQILSLMKFRRQHFADFTFTGLEEFTLTTPTGFTLNGHSINDILYTWVEPSTRIMAVQTRSESRKRSRTEANLDDDSGAEFSEKAGYKTPEQSEDRNISDQGQPSSE